MNKMGTKTLVEAALLTGIAAIIMIASAYVPFFILVGIIVWPVPITLLTFRHDIKTSIVALIALLVIVSGIITPVSALSMGLVYGVPAIVLGFCLRKKYSPFITIMAMALSMFLANILLFKAAALLTGVDLLRDSMKLYYESMDKSKEILKGLGVSEAQLGKSAQMTLSPELLNTILPGLLAVTALIGSYINYYFVGVIFRKLRIKVNEISMIKPIDEWYLNNNVAYGLFFITIISMGLMYLKVSYSEIVFPSVYFIFTFAFTINGLAVLAWFLKTRGISRKVRILIMVLVIFMNMGQILFFAGLIDFAIDFRKVNPLRGKRIRPGE